MHRPGKRRAHRVDRAAAPGAARLWVAHGEEESSGRGRHQEL